MGTYCTTTALETKMIGSTFDTSMTDLASASITDAEREINKMVAARYDISAWNTSTSVPPIISTICEWLAIGYTYEGNARGGKDAFARADRFIKRGMNNLEKIKDGEVDLTDDSGETITPLSTSSFAVYGDTDQYFPTFNEDSALDWKTDPDKLDDIRNERQ